MARMRTIRGAALLAMMAAGTGVTALAAAEMEPAPRQQFEHQGEVDALFAPWARSDSPGCSVAVTRDGRTVLERGYGMADLEQGVAIRPETVFNMASVSKQFTAASLLLLEQQGKLSVDDDIRKYVPEIPSYGKTITLRMLANHTSGMRDWPELLALAGWNWVDDVPPAWGLAMIARQKHLNFEPGSKYSYSNTGYFLMALVVERVSGQTLGEFADRHIFKPLGMLHSRFYDDRTMIMKNRAVGYLQRDDGSIGAWRPTYQVVGDGALLTTTGDMVLWERNFLEPRLGRDPAGLIAKMVEPTRLTGGKVSNYAFGLELGEYRGLKTVDHSGGIPGYRTFMLRFPEQKLSVQLMCNYSAVQIRKLAYGVAEAYLQDQFTAAAQPETKRNEPTKPASAPASQALPQFAGQYYSDELAATYTFTVDSAGLSSTVGYLAPRRWQASGTDRFVDAEEDGISIRFTRQGGPGGKISGFTLSEEDGIQALDFKRVTGSGR